MWRVYSPLFVDELDLHFVSRVPLSSPQTSTFSHGRLPLSCAYVRSGIQRVFLCIPAPSAGSRLYTPASQWVFNVCSLALPRSRQLWLFTQCKVSGGWGGWRVGQRLFVFLLQSLVRQALCPNLKSGTFSTFLSLLRGKQPCLLLGAQVGFLPLSLWKSNSAMYQCRILDLKGFLRSPLQ